MAETPCYAKHRLGIVRASYMLLIFDCVHGDACLAEPYYHGRKRISKIAAARHRKAPKL